MSGIPIRGHAKGSADAACATAKARGARQLDFTRDYFVALYQDAAARGIDADVLVAQWSLETGDGTSEHWQEEGNPAGLGVFDDGSHLGLAFSPRTAARAHVTHMARYLGMGAMPADWIATDARWQAVADAGFVGAVTTTADLGNGRWATDPDYASKLRSRYLAYWGEPGDVHEEHEMTTFSTELPGLPGGPLETSFPIKLKIVPAWRTLNRPGIRARTPRRSVQHGNGNPNSTAAGEATYLFNGADGRQASYHLACDDKEAWCMVPLDEVTWQAADGAGPGNMNGVSCEMVEDEALWADDARREACIANNAELMGKIAARLDIERPERHWDFNAADPDRHHCPNKLMSLGLWAAYEAQWLAHKAAETARMQGQGQQPDVPAADEFPPTLSLPELDRYKGSHTDTIPGFVNLPNAFRAVWVGDRVKATRDTPRLRTFDGEDGRVGPDILQGQEFDVDWLILKLGDANSQPFYRTPFGTIVRVNDTARVGDVKAAA
ncbi:MAG TPA: N-acetylmuramoyl-L-alanine amidase [Thermomicrobiales bacterium]|nr:N-acetylmuramoyl-L-alanine amidase [Thermomicrobiales bacterium]